MAISYISLEEFSEICGVRPTTIKKRYLEIPGVIRTGNTYQVIEGTRYPVDKRTIRAKNREEKAYVLLKTISEERYISNADLGLYQDQFNELLTDLFNANLIRRNSLGNENGANSYDITLGGSALLRREKESAIEQIVLLTAKAGGTFLGSVCSAANN